MTMNVHQKTQNSQHFDAVTDDDEPVPLECSHEAVQILVDILFFLCNHSTKKLFVNRSRIKLVEFCGD